MGGYYALMNYKYSNLCTKAEPASLLPVDIYIDATRMDMEQVAIVGSPREDQLSIIPKDEHYLDPIVRGVFDAHPEFKLEIKYISEDLKREDERYLLYTMPEVNKDRRDLLVQAVDSLYDETKVQLELTANKDRINLINDLRGLPAEEIKEVEEAMDEAYNQYKDMAEKIHEEKVKEIEEGYERYLENHPEEQWEPAPRKSSPKPQPSASPSAAPSKGTQSSTPPEDEEEQSDYDVKKGFRMY